MNKYVLTERELMMVSALFLLFHPYQQDKKLLIKRELKKIIRSFNKLMAITNKNMNRMTYLKIAHESYDLKLRAFNKMTLDLVDKDKLNSVTMPALLRAIMMKEPDLLAKAEIDQKDIDSMFKKYNGDSLTFQSTMYANRLITELDVGLENIKGVSDDVIMKKSMDLVNGV